MIDGVKVVKLRQKDSKILVVPAFTGLGAPHWDPDARGAMFGLTRNTTSAEICLAALESAVYQTKDLMDTMQTDSGTNITQIWVDG